MLHAGMVEKARFGEADQTHAGGAQGVVEIRGSDGGLDGRYGVWMCGTVV